MHLQFDTMLVEEEEEEEVVENAVSLRLSRQKSSPLRNICSEAVFYCKHNGALFVANCGHEEQLVGSFCNFRDLTLR